MKNIKEKVYNFNTKYKEGFTSSEVKELLKDYPNINMDKFNNALMNITCTMKEGESVKHHYDIEKALICGTENRNLRLDEWD